MEQEVKRKKCCQVKKKRKENDYLLIPYFEKLID